MTTHVSDANFGEEVLNSKEPVLVDFWAEWCGPCLAIAPVIDELAGELQGQVKIVKLNVDENPVTPASYRVTGIPNLSVFANGELVKQIVGSRPKSVILKELDEYIA